MSNVDGRIIYEEKVRFPVIRGIVALFAVMTITFVVAYLYQRITGQQDDRSVPLWFSATILSAMALFTLFLANLVTLSIRMTENGAMVGFGIFRGSVRWEDVRECHRDRESSFLSAANWGVSMGFTGRKFRRMYNVMGCPRVVLELKGGRRALVFSTKYPEQVVDIIKGRIQEQKPV